MPFGRKWEWFYNTSLIKAWNARGNATRPWWILRTSHLDLIPESLHYLWHKWTVQFSSFGPLWKKKKKKYITSVDCFSVQKSRAKNQTISKLIVFSFSFLCLTALFFLFFFFLLLIIIILLLLSLILSLSIFWLLKAPGH